eukprot:m.171238 g.171238  ORF g.171238 m.171238 type:complete len:235 (-) comp17835_c1_seq6:2713-3417(-)
MSAKAIREVTGKLMLREQLARDTPGRETIRSAAVNETTDWDKLLAANPWLATERLVAKPDQLIKRRGQLGLVAINLDYEGAKAWIKERMGSELKIGSATGILRQFVIEPFVKHEQSDEYYVCMYATPTADIVLFHHEGGVDIGDVDAKASKLELPVGGDGLTAELLAPLLSQVPADRQACVLNFVLLLTTDRGGGGGGGSFAVRCQRFKLAVVGFTVVSTTAACNHQPPPLTGC